LTAVLEHNSTTALTLNFGDGLIDLNAAITLLLGVTVDITGLDLDIVQRKVRHTYLLPGEYIGKETHFFLNDLNDLHIFFSCS